MSQKFNNLFLLSMLILLPAISAAQENFSIFAAQKVVVADVIDRNDRPLSDGIKKVIRQSIIDVCANSEEYEVYEVNVEEIRQQLASNNQKVDFVNICKEIGQRADFIIFPSVKASRSAIGDTQDVNIFISATLYRIKTAAEVLANQAVAEATSQSIIKVSSELIAKMLGLSFEETSEDLMKKGQEYFDEQDFDSAALYFRKAAEQGHAGGQFYLGVCYHITQDDTEAARWIRKAAEQGHAEAQCSLGDIYWRGIGVTQDDTEAARWLRKAAEQGYPEAQSLLKVLGVQ